MLAVRAAKLGPNHAATLLGHYDLAMVYRSTKRLNQAISLLEETLAQAKANDLPETFTMQADLSACYLDVGRFSDAIPLLEEVHRKGRMERGLAWVGNDLLTAYVGDGRTADVIALTTEQVRAAREQFPADSVELAAELAPPGQALMEVQAYADAEPSC